MKSEKSKIKTRKTCLERYNVTTTLLDPETQNKGKKTNLALFGYENAMKSDIVKERLNNTNLLKYNEIRFFLTDEYLELNKLRNKEKTIKIYSKKLGICDDSVEILDDENLKIKNYCNNHPEFIISKNNLRNRLLYDVNICTECYPIKGQISIGEAEVKSFIENELNIKTTKIKINGKEIDIFIPDYNIGIEYDGLYWHSEYYKTKNYHINKTNDCEKENIMLLHIFEDEWRNKREIVKSVIRCKLGLIKNKVFARKCFIKKINFETTCEFLKINSIRDPVVGLYYFGLFYKDELVSIMTFEKRLLSINNDIEMGNEFEILQFCTKLNTIVVGGASKLIKFFIKEYNPRIIKAFIDRRYSNGKLYLTLGFKFVGNSDPNYKFYSLNKDKFLNETESYKIFDCGNMNFEMIVGE